jgi:hypothetical protein
VTEGRAPELVAPGAIRSAHRNRKRSHTLCAP